MNAILVKSGLISGEKSKNHNVNQEHQLIGSKKPKTVKDVSNKLVDHKVVDDLNPRRNDDRSNYQEFDPGWNKINLFSNYETNKDFNPTKMLGI